jgi:hypothetical protein
VSALARRNGWRGFDNAGAVERVEGGYEYACDGMPRVMGCGARVVVSRKWSVVGKKKSGWIVMYGQCFPDETSDDGKGNDLDVVLTFCPSCAEVVKRQDGA